jgi:aspartate/methionine/tyrosine aminotransferase
LRLGWLATRDSAVLKRCAELKDYTSICAGTPNECLGLMALRAREQCWERCNGIIDGCERASERARAPHNRTIILYQ